MWDVPEDSLMHCLNWALVTGDLPLENAHVLKLKRSETPQEKDVNQGFILVNEDNASIQAVPCLIELGIRAGCLEDRGENNNRYRLISKAPQPIENGPDDRAWRA